MTNYLVTWLTAR